MLSVRAHNLDRWPGLSAEPPRLPNMQLGLEIPLLKQDSRRKNSEGSLATSFQHLRQKNPGGGINRGTSLPPLHHRLLKGHSGNHQQRIR